jgi:hydroxymethylpyrimidine/phosphomethylpyrimidine kinase
MRSVLTIAGSDPSGGAGLQGDLKTFAAHRVYGMAVVTAITVQNTTGVTRVEPIAADLVGAQLAAVLSDIDPDAIKIGMLATAAVVRVVAAALLKHRNSRATGLPDWQVILDPVMSATQGGALLDVEGVTALREKLLPIATVVTPNTLEAERITNMRVRSVAEARRAAEQLVALGAGAAIVTGGHLEGPPIDVVFDGQQISEITGERIDSRHTHGTGCAFSSALAARLVHGDDLATAALGAKSYVAQAIARAPGLGHGRGPLGHG